MCTSITNLYKGLYRVIFHSYVSLPERMYPDHARSFCSVGTPRTGEEVTLNDVPDATLCRHVRDMILQQLQCWKAGATLSLTYRATRLLMGRTLKRQEVGILEQLLHVLCFGHLWVSDCVSPILPRKFVLDGQWMAMDLLTINWVASP
jgi:hypothetical protein